MSASAGRATSAAPPASPARRATTPRRRASSPESTPNSKLLPGTGRGTARSAVEGGERSEHGGAGPLHHASHGKLGQLPFSQPRPRLDESWKMVAGPSFLSAPPAPLLRLQKREQPREIGLLVIVHRHV